jgi:hypothetical protein
MDVIPRLRFIPKYVLFKIHKSEVEMRLETIKPVAPSKGIGNF